MDSISNAATVEDQAADYVEIALGEHRQRGSFPFSIGLLLEAVEKERESLQVVEQRIEELRLALSQRRRAIDQQEEMLRDLADSLTRERDW